MSCGVREYWVVNPLNRETIVYYFKEETSPISPPTAKRIVAILLFQRPVCRSGADFPVTAGIPDPVTYKVYSNLQDPLCSGEGLGSTS